MTLRGRQPETQRRTAWGDGAQGDSPSRRPSFRRIEIIGHQLVRPDWNRFAPTNSVNQKKSGLTYMPSRTLAMMNVPAIRRSTASSCMVVPFVRGARAPVTLLKRCGVGWKGDRTVTFCAPP